jgi:hypothetical protein
MLSANRAGTPAASAGRKKSQCADASNTPCGMAGRKQGLVKQVRWRQDLRDSKVQWPASQTPTSVATMRSISGGASPSFLSFRSRTLSSSISGAWPAGTGCKASGNKSAAPNIKRPVLLEPAMPAYLGCFLHCFPHTNVDHNGTTTQSCPPGAF